ncbi:MAG TPA: hypothetical protein VFR75_05260, partial [Solirubrobacterales bacterium]|nr:hypothetical protein [Solirubrobacterales bacterium]
YGLASRLRGACTAAAQLEEGIPPQQVESSLKMHPYAATQLVRRLGGADYGDELALTIALRRAAAGAA